ncbi:hypothetical protein [Thiocapsa bogorovii]|nr:hypothetical protein [Thiocapsa bogorovii]
MVGNPVRHLIELVAEHLVQLFRAALVGETPVDELTVMRLTPK